MAQPGETGQGNWDKLECGVELKEIKTKIQQLDEAIQTNRLAGIRLRELAVKQLRERYQLKLFLMKQRHDMEIRQALDLAEADGIRWKRSSQMNVSAIKKLL